MALAAASAMEHAYGDYKMDSSMKHEKMDSYKKHNNMFYYMPHHMNSYRSHEIRDYNQRHFPVYSAYNNYYNHHNADRMYTPYFVSWQNYQSQFVRVETSHFHACSSTIRWIPAP